MKGYYIQDKIGTARHVVSYYDGEKQHSDGSAFFDIAICKNKKNLRKFLNKLSLAGYREGTYDSLT